MPPAAVPRCCCARWAISRRRPRRPQASWCMAGCAISNTAISGWCANRSPSARSCCAWRRIWCGRCASCCRRGGARGRAGWCAWGCSSTTGSAVRIACPARDRLICGTIRFVKGSHIVVPRLYPGDHAYLLQNDDRRIVFVIPFEREFSLIGTTELPFSGDPATAEVTGTEVAYLCDAVARWFARPPHPADVVWHYV